MDIQKEKCSYKEHGEIDAHSYCRECKVYMCNKCEQFHSNLCQNHKYFILDKNITNIFTGFCKEEKHNMELEFYCKTHNQLCCGACIAKIKTKYIGKHKDCEIYLLEDIKNDKINKLNDNIIYLEELSKTLQESVIKIKEIYEKINENKEELKLKIQKIFTKIRNELNNREDELLLEVDNKYDSLFFKEDLIKEYEKLPDKIKISLEKSKIIDQKNNSQLNILINDCVDIENSIIQIKDINEKINKSNDIQNEKMSFYPDDKLFNEFLCNIKSFGKISNIDKSSIKFVFKNSSIIFKDIKSQNLIINWIKEKTNKNITKLELIFKMSKNGSLSKDFHKACDNQGPTLILIKSKNNKTFGGFTPLNWIDKGGGQYDKSNQTFLFSLNLMKKYDMININKLAIKCASYGPNFGDWDFKLGENLKEGVTYANANCNFLSDNNLELTGGRGNNISFEVEELEVYKVENK